MNQKGTYFQSRGCIYHVLRVLSAVESRYLQLALPLAIHGEGTIDLGGASGIRNFLVPLWHT